MKNKYLLLLVGLFLCLFFQHCVRIGQLPCINQAEQDNLESIPATTFTAEKGHLITLYQEEEGNTLRANVQVNPLDEKGKWYSRVPVAIEPGVNLLDLAKLNAIIQRKRIQVHLSQEGIPTTVAIHNPGLLGGKVEEIVLLVGNPGSGKSTLLNSILQNGIFPSGISLEEGLTKKTQGYLDGNTLYVDTPGLSDIRMKEQAAEEIGKALKYNNHYKIIFVATLLAGRINPADLVTINTICDAIKTDFEYGIVFNGLTDKIHAEAEKKGLREYLITLHKAPYAAVLLKRDNDLEDESDRYFSLESENGKKLLNFLNALKVNKITENDVETIDVRDFQEKVNEMEIKYKKQLAELHEKIDVQAKEMTTMSITQAHEVASLKEQITQQAAQIDDLESAQPDGFLKGLGVFVYLAGSFVGGMNQGHFTG